MDWIELAQDRHSWQAIVNEVMNLQVLYNAGNFLTSYKLIFPTSAQLKSQNTQVQLPLTAASNQLNLKAFRYETYPAVTTVQGATKRVVIDRYCSSTKSATDS
jgi:hypothetical protein